MVPIYINDKEYFIYPKTDYLDAGASGKCYKVCDDDRILTVKLYLSESGLSGEEVFFPDEETLEKLIQLSPYASPILLSQYLVRDGKGNYIGCARDYIKASSPNTTEAVFQLPKEKALEHFQKIEEKIPIFNENGILLDDWNSYNVMFGRVANGDEKLYVFDDSSYTLSSYHRQSNHHEFTHLIEDMIEEYLLAYNLELVRPYVIDKLRASYTPIHFFENISNHSNTLGEGVLQYAKKMKDRYY